MKHNDHSFESRLAGHFKQSKRAHRLSWKERWQLKKQLRPAHDSSGFRPIQGVLAVCGLALFAVLFYRHELPQPQEKNLYSVNLSGYPVHEVHEIVAHQYVSHDMLQQLDQQREAALLANRRHHAQMGTLLSTQDGWFIASCDRQVMIEVKQSLLAQLGSREALPQNPKTGDILKLERNNEGDILALSRVASNAEQCGPVG